MILSSFNLCLNFLGLKATLLNVFFNLIKDIRFSNIINDKRKQWYTIISVNKYFKQRKYANTGSNNRLIIPTLHLDTGPPDPLDWVKMQESP